LDIRNVKLRGQNQDGQRVNALADRALAKGDGSLLTLLGNVQVTQSPNGSKGLQTPTVMRSQEIKAYLKEERLVSDLPVEIRRGTNVFTAQAMQMNSKTGVYELSGKVRGVLHAN
jgi:lipopolysaccharide export system protein LptC